MKTNQTHDDQRVDPLALPRHVVRFISRYQGESDYMVYDRVEKTERKVRVNDAGEFTRYQATPEVRLAVRAYRKEEEGIDDENSAA
jgi:hypothetical protein